MKLSFPHVQISQIPTTFRQVFPGLFYYSLPSQCDPKETDIPLCAATAIWHQVDSEVLHLHGVHERYWWMRSGYALAVLLHNAGYSSHAQYQSLIFFATVITSSLGAPNEPPLVATPWKSFMTDDGNPIELSWDWHTGTKSPTIRFSIEPVGVHAGTTIDPENRHAASIFHQTLLQSLPQANVEWFDHFKEKFKCRDVLNGSAQEGHLSQIFYAFDLAEDSITSKAYFFPGFTAREMGQKNLARISQAIATAPSCTPEMLEALSVFQEFATDPSNPALEIDMLAIDLISPTASRLKIYFRNRETSFSSVQRTMTLRNRIQTPELMHGLSNLKRLWEAVFKLEESPDDASLPARDHRTAGILYNVEFSLGNVRPRVKIYIPVRHYASSDSNILHGLNDYLYSINGSKCRYMPGYVRALDAIL